MGDLLAVLLIAVVAGAVGLRLGILAAPRLVRLTDRLAGDERGGEGADERTPRD